MTASLMHLETYEIKKKKSIGKILLLEEAVLSTTKVSGGKMIWIFLWEEFFALLKIDIEL